MAFCSSSAKANLCFKAALLTEQFINVSLNTFVAVMIHPDSPFDVSSWCFELLFVAQISLQACSSEGTNWFKLSSSIPNVSKIELDGLRLVKSESPRLLVLDLLFNPMTGLFFLSSKRFHVDADLIELSGRCEKFILSLILGNVPVNLVLGISGVFDRVGVVKSVLFCW